MLHLSEDVGKSPRIHIDLLAPNHRIQTFLGAEDGSDPGLSCGIALFRETRQPQLLAILRQPYKVAVVVETDASGKPVARRISE